MIDKPLTDVGPDDLQRLLANRVPESRSLEYKQALPGGNDAGRKEFLADVSSFANATGGDLIYGIAEAREDGRATGVPESIPGLEITNTDAETRRLENMLRDGIAPRLPGVQFRWVPRVPESPVLIVRVPRSWAGPHMVTYQQHSRFYSRNAGGKYPLDVFELRQAFLGSGSLSERAREFRTERLGRLLAGETPVPLSSPRLVCVHLIPHASLAGATDIDLQLAASRTELLQPFYADRWGSGFNLDGVLACSPAGNGSNMAYLQVYWSGILETVSSEQFADYERAGLTFPARTFADGLVQFLDRGRRLLRALTIDPLASLYASLLSAKGVTLAIGERWTFGAGHSPRPFDRDTLPLREVLLTEWDGDPRVIVKSLLDELWQAAGLPRCLNYDDQGN
jgi:hypothetical protein